MKEFKDFNLKNDEMKGIVGGISTSFFHEFCGNQSYSETDWDGKVTGTAWDECEVAPLTNDASK